MYPVLYILNGIVIVLISVCTALYMLTKRQRDLTKTLPGLPALPCIGNIHQVISKDKYLCLKEFSELAITNNSMSKVWFGPALVLVIVKPEDIKAVTNTFLEKPFFYKLGRPWLGNGLVTAPASDWKRNIKKLGTTFTGSIIDGFQDVFNSQAYKLVDKLKTEIGQPAFDPLNKYLAFVTLETICQTAMSVNDISKSIVTTEYYEAFNRGLQLIISRGFNVLMYSDFVYSLTPQYREFKKCLQVIHNVSKTVIAKRKQERAEEKNNTTSVNNQQESSQPKTFLDVLLELSETDDKMTDEQIRAEVDTVIVGGQETTATSMHYILIMLGRHPDVQNKLAQEIDGIFGSSDRPVTKEDMSSMKYCEAVINEALRLFPPIPGVLRYADSDLQLDNYMIPAGTTCFISSWGAARAACWGPDAELFVPERWLDSKNLPPSSAFAPFSYGRRSCIGKKYSMALMKTIIAHCVRNFEFIAENEELEFQVNIALRLTRGHLVQVRSRTSTKNCTIPTKHQQLNM